ncbi:MAG: AI-2E family transporter, partial [Desulfomonilaceae bacterium]
MITSNTTKTIVRIGAGIIFMIFLVWMMSALESVTTLLLVAFFMAYILNPLTTILESKGFKRSIASFIVLCVVFAICVGLILLVAPAIFSELAGFSKRAPRYFTKLQEFTGNVFQSLPLDLPQDWNELIQLAFERIKESLPKITYAAGMIISSVFASTVSVLSTLFKIILVPIIAFYLLVSFNDITSEAADLIPAYTRGPIVNKFREIDAVIAAFVRGQLIIALIMAFLYSLGFIIIGIDLPVVLGILSGLLFVIPYFGTLVAIVGGSLMSFVKFGDVWHIGYVLLWIAVVQLLESYFLTPRIVGQAVGLNPVVYILVLIVGANLFGFVGMLVAIPVAAVTRVVLASAVDAYR